MYSNWYHVIFPYDDSSLMKPEFVAMVFGMSYREAERFIKRSKDAVRIGDQWYLPFWSVKEELNGDFPAVSFADVSPCEESSGDYMLFIEGPARIVSTKEMR